MNTEVWNTISQIIVILLCLIPIVTIAWLNINQKTLPTSLLLLTIGLLILSIGSFITPKMPVSIILIYTIILVIYLIFLYAKLKRANPSTVETVYNDNANLISFTQEQERSRIYANLHDDVGAKLLELIYTAKDDETKKMAKNILSNIRQAVAQTENIQCTMIQLAEAIISEAKMRLQPTSIVLIDTIYLLNNRQKLSRVIPNVVLRISREVISNIIKHAKSSEIKINISSDSSTFTIEITDNGIGFIATRATGKGLKTIEKRAQSIHAQVQWDSKLNQGTAFKLTHKYGHE